MLLKPWLDTVQVKHMLTFKNHCLISQIFQTNRTPWVFQLIRCRWHLSAMTLINLGLFERIDKVSASWRIALLFILHWLVYDMSNQVIRHWRPEVFPHSTKESHKPCNLWWNLRSAIVEIILCLLPSGLVSFSFSTRLIVRFNYSDDLSDNSPILSINDSSSHSDMSSRMSLSSLIILILVALRIWNTWWCRRLWFLLRLIIVVYVHSCATKLTILLVIHPWWWWLPLLSIHRCILRWSPWWRGSRCSGRRGFLLLLLLFVTPLLAIWLWRWRLLLSPSLSLQPLGIFPA